MEKEAEKFLKAEETAVKLVETLKQLHNETTSYQTATKELDIVRQRLLKLIESTERVANGSHEVIKVLKEMGGPEILNRIKEVEKKVFDEFAKQSANIEKVEKEFVEEFAKQSAKIEKVEKEFVEEFAKQSKYMDRLKTLMIVTLASSITAVIIGIIVLLR